MRGENCYTMYERENLNSNSPYTENDFLFEINLFHECLKVYKLLINGKKNAS